MWQRLIGGSTLELTLVNSGQGEAGTFRVSSWRRYRKRKVARLAALDLSSSGSSGEQQNPVGKRRRWLRPAVEVLSGFGSCRRRTVSPARIKVLVSTTASRRSRRWIELSLASPRTVGRPTQFRAVGRWRGCRRQGRVWVVGGDSGKQVEHDGGFNWKF